MAKAEATIGKKCRFFTTSPKQNDMNFTTQQAERGHVYLERRKTSTHRAYADRLALHGHVQEKIKQAEQSGEDADLTEAEMALVLDPAAGL